MSLSLRSSQPSRHRLGLLLATMLAGTVVSTLAAGDAPAAEDEEKPIGPPIPAYALEHGSPTPTAATGEATNGVTPASAPVNVFGAFTLGINQYVVNSDWTLAILLQGDGNLYFLSRGSSQNGWNVLWEAPGVNGRGTSASFQGDGNFVVYQGATEVWMSGVQSHGATLEISGAQPYMTVLSTGGATVWTSGCVLGSAAVTFLTLHAVKFKDIEGIPEYEWPYGPSCKLENETEGLPGVMARMSCSTAATILSGLNQCGVSLLNAHLPYNDLYGRTYSSALSYAPAGTFSTLINAGAYPSLTSAIDGQASSPGPTASNATQLAAAAFAFTLAGAASFSGGSYTAANADAGVVGANAAMSWLNTSPGDLQGAATAAAVAASGEPGVNGQGMYYTVLGASAVASERYSTSLASPAEPDAQYLPQVGVEDY